jgi:hypothetical protein
MDCGLRRGHAASPNWGQRTSFVVWAKQAATQIAVNLKGLQLVHSPQIMRCGAALDPERIPRPTEYCEVAVQIFAPATGSLRREPTDGEFNSFGQPLHRLGVWLQGSLVSSVARLLQPWLWLL